MTTDSEIAPLIGTGNYSSVEFPHSRQSQRIADLGDFPRVFLIDTVNYCNLRCAMCGRRKMTRKGGMMDMKLYHKIIDEIAETDKRARVWLVFFGDPFMLGKRLYPYITYAKGRGLEDVILNTNGNLVNEDVARKLIQTRVDAIYFGIDAFSAETYSKFRVGGNYERVVRNVNYLLDLKGKMGVDRPRIVCQYVLMEGNEGEVDGFMKYWTSRGATVKVRPKVSWAGAVKAENVDRRDRHPCYWGMQSFNVLYDGRVVLCAVDYDGRFVAGDISKQSIWDVWNSELKRKVRDIMLAGKWEGLPSFCRDCTDWQKAVNVTYEPR